MDTNNAEQTRVLERDLGKIESRLDRHLEIYAQNGKELAALKAAVDGLSRIIDGRFQSEDKNEVNQWVKINENHKNIEKLNIKVSEITVKVAAWSALASAISAAVAVTMALKLIG